MNKLLIFLSIFISTANFGQHFFDVNEYRLQAEDEIFIDDYNDIYLYNRRNFTVVKIDHSKNQKGKLLLPHPYKIQSVQNPLNIIFFSENSQEVKFFDTNLNEIQTLKLNPKFGFVKAVFVEDLQFLWLIDASTQTLLQYNYRDEKTVTSTPFYFTENVKDFLVFENKIYIISNNYFRVYNLKGEVLFSEKIEAEKLKLYNNTILVITKNSFYEYKDQQKLEGIFSLVNAQIVDKNQSHYLALIDDKLYLYNIEDEDKKQ